MVSEGERGTEGALGSKVGGPTGGRFWQRWGPQGHDGLSCPIHGKQHCWPDAWGTARRWETEVLRDELSVWMK